MWFKSAKNFKENQEDKTLLFTITMQTLNSFDKLSNYENHQQRGLFVDELLNERGIKIIKIKSPKETIEVEKELRKMRKLKYID